MIGFSYRCIECSRGYAITTDRMICDTCADSRTPSEPLRGLLEVVFAGSVSSDWRVHDLLPVEREWFPPIPVGNTPLWTPERLRDDLGFPRLFFKDDTANPTGSLKDRASYLVAAFARKHGIGKIVLASTGNAGSSMAGVGAAAGLDVKLYLPRTAPAAKLAQAAQYGAKIVRVDGTYDEAYDMASDAAKKEGCLSRNTAYNPMTIEGKKTVSLEIHRDLLRFGVDRVPDYVFVPAGDGVIVSGVYRGFEDLVKLSLTDRMPNIVAAQASGSSAIARAFAGGGFDTPVRASPVADSISVDVPRGGYFALDRLTRFGGDVVTITDVEILEAQHHLAARSGLFAEPAAAASFAGFLKYREQIPTDASVVIIITGSGLKDVGSAMKGAGLDG